MEGLEGVALAPLPCDARILLRRLYRLGEVLVAPEVEVGAVQLSTMEEEQIDLTTKVSIHEFIRARGWGHTWGDMSGFLLFVVVVGKITLIPLSPVPV